MATTNDLKNGMVLNLDGQLWSVIWFQHHKPGKGGAVVRTKLKNIGSGKTVDKTFNADVKVEIANVDKRTMQYLYNDGTSYVFMDTSTYEQLEVSPEIVGDAKNFLLENQDAIVATNEGRVLYIELPASVELLVEYTEPGLQGDRSTGGTKPATSRDRPRDQRPALHRDRREDQGGHARQQLPGSRQLLMSARSKARKRALDVLFECEVRGLPLGATLDERVVAADPPVNEYTVQLIRGIAEHQARIDELVLDVRPGLVDRADARGGPQRAADRRVRGDVRRRRARRGRGQRGDGPGARPVDRRVAGFVNGVLGNIVRNKPAVRLTSRLAGDDDLLECPAVAVGVLEADEAAPRLVVDALAGHAPRPRR